MDAGARTLTVMKTIPFVEFAFTLAPPLRSRMTNITFSDRLHYEIAVEEREEERRGEEESRLHACFMDDDIHEFE